MSEFKFMHTLSELKSIFSIEQKAVATCFVKNVAFLLGHPAHEQSCTICSFQIHG